MIDLINEYVLSRPSDGEQNCYYKKMIGDYYRYIAENSHGQIFDCAKDNALNSYLHAMAVTLPACNSVRLGLILNFSVFQYELLK